MRYWTPGITREGDAAALRTSTIILTRFILVMAVMLILTATLALPQTTSIIEGTVADQQGLLVSEVEIHVANDALGIDRHVLSGTEGAYRFPGLPAGSYSITASMPGFARETLHGLELTVNQTLRVNLVLKVGTQAERVEVMAAAPLLESVTSSTGSTITPQQIDNMPLNGRNYLDLLQLVPGVALNRQQDPALDGAVPILGERGGNAIFLIDGLPNRDEVNGGAAAQFNQDSILEFQVLTGGYKAEFGHGSGGIINVVSKSGTNDWHGGASFFLRNYKLDSSDSRLVLSGAAPFLLRYDPSGQIGGPIAKDKVFLFASAERILENRQLNFQFPPTTPPALIQAETPFNLHSRTFDTRARAKLDEVSSRHHLTEQFNLTNSHVTDYLPLVVSGFYLPSTRNNLSSRHLMLGFSDAAILGDQSNPFLVNLYAQYRGEPADTAASHTEGGLAATLFNLYSSLNTGQLFGDLGEVQFGPGHTPLGLAQQYVSSGINVAKQAGRHNWKFGWDFQQTNVDGTEATNLLNQLFATVADFQQFGPVNSGIYYLTAEGGATPNDNLIRLRNAYNGVFVQDDLKVSGSLMLNLGVRWDYDNRFPNKTNFSPRLGLAWSITPKTVVRANWGIFYDHFRLGLARDIPGFGGANLINQAFLSFPRLFYGDPTTATSYFASQGLPVPCASSNLTDAQIAASGAQCPAAGLPFYGIDHLNSVVAPGHAPIPANAVVNMSNVQSLTGLTPQQFADAASAAIGVPAGAFSYDPFGNLTIGGSAFPTSGIPISVDARFRTPHTNGFYAGVQRELSANLAIHADYYHKNIDNILGARYTNLALEARIPGHTGETSPAGSPLVIGYGPWLHGSYDAVTLGFRKRMSKGFTVEASYTWTHEIDNALNSNFVSDQQTQAGAGVLAAYGPTDSFVGMTTLVTDPVTGQTNAKGPFTASNGAPVPKAGIFYNGLDLDKGPSDLALNHTLLAHGLAQLPWKIDLSAIFRAQSGFHYSALAIAEIDADGQGSFNGIDFTKGRNHFIAPPFVNLDVRVGRKFKFNDRLSLHAYLEFFNLLNQANPAAINIFPPVASSEPAFGQVLQVLPGREGQAGVRLEF